MSVFVICFSDTLYKLINWHLSAQLHQTLIQYNQTKCIRVICTSLSKQSISPHSQFHVNMEKRFLGKHLLQQHPYYLIRGGRVWCVCVGLQFSRLHPAEPQLRLNAAASYSPSRLEEDQRQLRAAQARRWTSGALRSPLPVRRRAPGLQTSGVNLSDCQAKYWKRLAITETVKGHTQFPELFTQLESPLQDCQE